MTSQYDIDRALGYVDEAIVGDGRRVSDHAEAGQTFGAARLGVPRIGSLNHRGPGYHAIYHGYRINFKCPFRLPPRHALIVPEWKKTSRADIYQMIVGRTDEERIEYQELNGWLFWWEVVELGVWDPGQPRGADRKESPYWEVAPADLRPFETLRAIDFKVW